MAFKLEIAEKTANPGQSLQVWESTSSEWGKSASKLTQDKIDAYLTLLGNSNFLARWSRRNPDKALEILKTDLDRAWNLAQYLKELGQTVKELSGLSTETFHTRLLDFKYRHFFRITLRDMGMGKSFTEIAKEISDLANAILQTALSWQSALVQEEFGKPFITDTKQINSFCILGLGKLGGRELNYSSDVDLIYFYGSDKGYFQKNKNSTDIFPHEYFTKLSERFTKLINKKASTGFLYRVDLELRPEGNNGALTNSIDAMEDYYETFGAGWEKQAMIKASCSGGSQELFEEFIKRIHPFVYPKIADYSFLIKLNEMKKKLLQSIQASSETGYHIKLGEGGIREIEFFVQSFQILFGGKLPQLQTSNTLEAISKLQTTSLISRDQADRLTQAYVFYRTVENRLQQVEEQQTHRIPENQEEQIKFLKRLGYEDEDRSLEEFNKVLEQHRSFVNQSFNDLLKNPPTS